MAVAAVEVDVDDAAVVAVILYMISCTSYGTGTGIGTAIHVSSLHNRIVHYTVPALQKSTWFGTAIHISSRLLLFLFSLPNAQSYM